MAVLERVQFESASEILIDELSPDIKLRETVIYAEVLDKRGEPLIQPQVCPPLLQAQQQ